MSPQGRAQIRTIGTDLTIPLGLFEVDAIGDDDDLSHVYLPNFKQL